MNPMDSGSRTALAGFLAISLGLAAPPQPAPKPDLQILIIGGEGSINNIKQRTAREPVVEVRDKNDRPVAGAIVLFTAPQRGASGVYPGGSNPLAVATDTQGQAVARVFQPNSGKGPINLHVNASYQGSTADAHIHKTNVAGGGGGGFGAGKIVGIVAAVGAAAAVGVIAGTRGGKSTGTPTTPTSTPTTISAGSGTVGPRP